MKTRLTPTIWLLGLLIPFQLSAEDLTVLGNTDKGISPGREVEAALIEKLNARLDHRDEELSKVQSRAEAAQWQEERREFFIKQIGGLRAPAPVHGKITGELKADGYRVEKILIEDRPSFHITANLYLPPGKGPHPAVLIPCGHSHNGKAAGHYQRAAILFAKNGMAALCYDPLGQGERYQIIDRAQEQEYFSGLGKRKLAVPHPAVQYLCTVEHTVMGLGSILLGSNTAHLRVRDGMRCIDYLQSRDDILANKIGCTGNSGGGTLTSYLMAVDDRIAAAAPGCYLTTFRKLIETKGVQDAEQNIFGQIAFGLDQPDFVMMRAPRPTLVLAAIRDATFDIDGTWDLFRQSKTFYTRLGFAERVDMVAADAPHGYYIQQREAAARFMHRWLIGEDKVIRERGEWPDPLTDEQNYALKEGDWTQEELYCTPQGQVLLMDGEESVFQGFLSRETAIRPGRSAKWSAMDYAQQKETIRGVIGAELPGTPESESVGTVSRPGYVMEKIVLRPQADIRLPALFIRPEEKSGKAILYLHDKGSAEDAAPGGPIEQLVAEGNQVLAVDLRGLGETKHEDSSRNWAKGVFGPNLQSFFLAYLNGQSFVGMRTEDILSSASFLIEETGVKKIDLIAKGEAAIPALHASAVNPAVFSSTSLTGEFQVWQDFLTTEKTWEQAANVVHGALLHYDLPDLIQLAEEEGVVISPPESLRREAP